jgi:hypothetical protein
LGQLLQTGGHRPLDVGVDRRQQLGDFLPPAFGDQIDKAAARLGQANPNLTPVATIRPASH